MRISDWSSDVCSSDLLKDQPLTTGALCGHFADIDRCTVMQHLKVLEDAGLVIPERRGRERWNHLNAMPIQDIHDRWVGPHAAAATARLARFKQAVRSEEHTSELQSLMRITYAVFCFKN